jgi:large subunit ribosomal protein L5
MVKDFGYSNVHEVPRISKVVVNIGLGEALQNAKALERATEDLATITGQRPVITRAKKSIATFRLREGNPIGVKVTLRGNRMWDFLDRLINISLARQRDFRGISPDSFDGRGNYTLGLAEQLVWPEINYDKIDKVRGMEISIVTTAQNDEEGRRLLDLMGMPFRR